MTLEALNAADQTSFVEAVGWVFEQSPWVAERAWASRPFASVEALHQTMVKQVDQATPNEQLALLRAHPDLGARAKLSDASAMEQSGAGLNQLSPDEFEMITTLNAEYKRKFGFPFLYAVKGSSKNDVLVALAIRLESTYEDEFAAALWEVYRIAAFRLNDYLKSD